MEGAKSAQSRDAGTFATTRTDFLLDACPSRLVEPSYQFDVVLACDIFYSMDPDNNHSPAAVSRLARQVLRPDGVLFACFPVESEHRTRATHAEAKACIDSLVDGGFSVQDIAESSGSQIPSEGPEGLATSRKVLMATLALEPAAQEKN
jgi:hypothetical protein